MDKTSAELNWDRRWHDQEGLFGEVTQKLRLNDKGLSKTGRRGRVGSKGGGHGNTVSKEETAWACSGRDQREAKVVVISEPGGLREMRLERKVGLVMLGFVAQGKGLGFNSK